MGPFSRGKGLLLSRTHFFVTVNSKKNFFFVIISILGREKDRKGDLRTVIFIFMGIDGKGRKKRAGFRDPDRKVPVEII